MLILNGYWKIMMHWIKYCFIILSLNVLRSESKLEESIEYILDGNYIYKNKYIDNSNNESYYYNNIYTLTNNDNVENNYLKGLIEFDGEKSKSYFEDYYLSFPDNKYADDSIVKVAEYYYSSGLYIQSSEWYKKITLNYPKSEHFQKSVSYFLNSLIIAGYKDTANFYIKKFRKDYPKLKFSNEYIVESYRKDKKKKNDHKSDSYKKSKYSVQIGSFENYELAKSKKTILSNEGFLCRIDEILVDGNSMYSVRIGIFGSHDLARKEQKRLISRIGLYDSIIIELK
tara:strand:+ start:1134 stop:1988 length:855 start_codon:yes stop_codon:yes gene_type:complete